MQKENVGKQVKKRGGTGAMKKDNTFLFREMPVPKAVLSLIIPTVISQLITVAYNMADTFYIGQLNDPTQVAAVTVVMPAFILLTAISNLFGIGGASLISRSLGSNDRDRAKQTATFCILAGIVTAFAYGMLLMLFRPYILPLLGAKETTYRYSSQYMFWTITVGAVPTVMNSELAHLVRAEGYSKHAGIGIAFGGILNMLLDPLFIFVFDMKIKGAAIATMLSNIAAVAYFVLLLLKNRRTTVIFPDIRLLRSGLRSFPEVVAVGFPSFVMFLMSTISNGALNHMISAYSDQAIAGMGIAKKIDMVAIALAQGMTQGALPLIGYNYTSNDRRRMNSAVKTTLVYALGTALVAAVLLTLCSGQVTRLFIDDDITVGYGRSFLRTIAIACPSTTLNCMIITVFQATGRKIRPLILSLLRKGVIDIPLMILLNTAVGVSGIAWATPIADFTALAISACLFIPYMREMDRKSRVV